MSNSTITKLPGIRSLFPDFDETDSTSSPTRPQSHNSYTANRPFDSPYYQNAASHNPQRPMSLTTSAYPQSGAPRLLSAFPPESADDAESGKDGRRHTCPHCHKRFNRPSSLKIHINTHTGAKPFECPHPGCGRQFNVSSNMRRHFRNHASGTHMQLDMEHDMPRLQQSSGYTDSYGVPFSSMSSPSSSYSTPSPRTRSASIPDNDPQYFRRMPPPPVSHPERQFRYSYPYPTEQHRSRSASSAAYQRNSRQPPNPPNRNIVPTSSLLIPHSSTQTPMYSYPPPLPPNAFSSNMPPNFAMPVTLPPAPSARISMPVTL